MKRTIEDIDLEIYMLKAEIENLQELKKKVMVREATANIKKANKWLEMMYKETEDHKYNFEIEKEEDVFLNDFELKIISKFNIPYYKTRTEEWGDEYRGYGYTDYYTIGDLK